MANADALDHERTLEALPAGFLSINEQLRSDVRRGAPTVAIRRARGPGETDAFAVALVPGRALVCFVTDDDGVKHSLKGMVTEIRGER